MKRKFTGTDTGHIANAETTDTYRVLDHFDSSDEEDNTTVSNRKHSTNTRKVSGHGPDIMATPKLGLACVSRIRKMKTSPELSFGTEEGRKAFGSTDVVHSISFKSPFSGGNMSKKKF